MKKNPNLKNISKSAGGITLIALVITVIVLLILAGIGVTMLTGENSIMNKAGQAKENTEKAQLKEQADIVKNGMLLNKVQNNTELTQSELVEGIAADSYFKGSTVIGNKVVTSENKWDIRVSSDLSITVVPHSDKLTLVELYEKGDLKIGDYVNYNPTDGATQATVTSDEDDNGYEDQEFVLANYTGQWRVLGIENAQVILMSTKDVGPEGEDYTWEEDGHTYVGFNLNGRIGYENSVGELKKVCQLYGQGKYADKAKTRSINVDDINKITGYNPNCVGVKNPTEEQIATGTKFSSGKWNEYGNRVTYKFKGATLLYATSTNRLGHILNYQNAINQYNTFWWYNNGWQSLTNEGEGEEETNIATIETTAYDYYPETLTEEEGASSIGIAHNSTEYEMLFGADEYSEAQYNGYWLGSQCVYTDSKYAAFHDRIVYEGEVTHDVLYRSYISNISDRRIWCSPCGLLRF